MRQGGKLLVVLISFLAMSESVPFDSSGGNSLVSFRASTGTPSEPSMGLSPQTVNEKSHMRAIHPLPQVYSAYTKINVSTVTFSQSNLFPNPLLRFNSSGDVFGEHAHCLIALAATDDNQSFLSPVPSPNFY